VTTCGFARFGVGGDDVAFTLARIFSLAIAPGSRSLAGALALARIPTDALDLRRSRRARRVLGTYHAAGEGQCDRGRKHRSCYPGFVHRLNLLFRFEIRRRAEGADFSRFISVAPGALDLKITFAWFRVLPLAGFDLHRFDLVVDLAKPMLKFRRLDLHPNLAALADDMSFSVLFDFAHQQRVLETAFRTGNVYGFVFKHIETS
jgi:hypothetical protein